MNDERLRELTERFLDNTLSEVQAEELADAFDASEEVRERLFAEAGMASLLAATQSDADVREQVMAALRNTQEKADLVDRVVKDLPPRRNGRRREHASKPLWGMWVAAAACIIAVVGVLFYNRSIQQTTVDLVRARLQESSGTVSIERADGTTAPGVTGADIYLNDTVVTETDGKASLRYTDENTIITITPGASLKLTESANTGKRLELEKGVAECDVDEQEVGRELILATPRSEAKVIGTRFKLSAEEDLSRLEVAEGLVEFTRLPDRQMVKVPEGHYAVAGSGCELVALSLAGTPPAVNAAADRTELILPENAIQLTGMTFDPDIPAEKVTVEWQKLSGPGEVAFADPDAPDTEAIFTEAGTYVLRLTGKDSRASGHSDVTVTVRPKPAWKEVFADTFENSPVGQWPRGWGKHGSEGATRSGFRVRIDVGNRYVSDTAGTAGSQHAYLPLKTWPERFEISMRMRVSASDVDRAGLEFDGPDHWSVFAVEYDATKGRVHFLVRQSGSTDKVPVKEASVRLSAGTWTTWKLERNGNTYRLHIDGKPVLEHTWTAPKPFALVSIVSRGSGFAQFDDIRVRHFASH